jgi:hypothetical protein
MRPLDIFYVKEDFILLVREKRVGDKPKTSISEISLNYPQVCVHVQLPTIFTSEPTRHAKCLLTPRFTVPPPAASAASAC